MNLKQLFIELGYTEEEYNKIRFDYVLSKLKDETIAIHVKDIFNYFTSIGYTREEIIKMSKKFPIIYSLYKEGINQKMEDLCELGYTHEEVIKLTKKYPALYSYSIENIKRKIEDYYSLGYTREEVIKLSKKFPSIYGISIEFAKQKIKNICELGYTYDDVIKMIKKSPSIYSLLIENIKQKIEDLCKLGYTKEEVIQMTKNLPALFEFSTENIKGKINFYDSIGMHELAIVNPLFLMQSVPLSYARYMFYIEKGIKVDMSNYRKLFIENKQFERAYGITKEELLEKYDYNEFLELKEKEGKNDRVIKYGN